MRTGTDIMRDDAIKEVVQNAIEEGIIKQRQFILNESVTIKKPIHITISTSVKFKQIEMFVKQKKRYMDSK